MKSRSWSRLLAVPGLLLVLAGCDDRRQPPDWRLRAAPDTGSYRAAPRFDTGPGRADAGRGADVEPDSTEIFSTDGSLPIEDAPAIEPEAPLSDAGGDCRPAPEPKGECYRPVESGYSELAYCRFRRYARTPGGRLELRYHHRIDHDRCGRPVRFLVDASPFGKHVPVDGIVDKRARYFYGDDGSRARMEIDSGQGYTTAHTYSYDETNRVRTETIRSLVQGGDLKPLRFEYSYDERGNLTKRRSSNPDGTQDKGHFTVFYEYASQCRPRKRIFDHVGKPKKVADTWRYLRGRRLYIRKTGIIGSEEHKLKYRQFLEEERVIESVRWEKRPPDAEEWRFDRRCFYDYDSKGRRTEHRCYRHPKAGPRDVPDALLRFDYDCSWR